MISFTATIVLYILISLMLLAQMHGIFDRVRVVLHASDDCRVKDITGKFIDMTDICMVAVPFGIWQIMEAFGWVAGWLCAFCAQLI